MLKTTMSLHVLTANKVLGARVLTANEFGNFEGGDGLEYKKLKARRSEN